MSPPGPPTDTVEPGDTEIRPIRTVLVDDQELVRAGLSFIISTEPGIGVVAEAANGELGVVAALAHRPDVVLMDIRMPVMDGITATARLRDAAGPPCSFSPPSTTTTCSGVRCRPALPASCSRTHRPMT